MDMRSITKMQCSKDYFYIDYPNNIGLIIPYNSFKDSDEKDRFKEIIIKNIGAELNENNF